MRAELDPAIQRLLGAVALGQGFQFHIVVCQSSHQVGQLLNTLADAVPRQRGGRVRCEHLAPYADLPQDRAWVDDALAQTVMARLNAMPTPSASELLLVALDATPAKEQDAAAWRRLFRRMNEQRNALVAGLDAAFLLCLPPWLESLFAHEATDFWSIRGLSVTLALTPQVALPFESPAAQKVSSAQLSVESFASSPASEEIAAARLRAQQMPDDWRAQRFLMILLDKQGEQHRVRGNSAAALDCFREALAIAESLVQSDPENGERQHDLWVSYNNLGDVAEAQGDLGEAARRYGEGLKIAQQLAASDAVNSEWQRDLSVSYNNLGDVAAAQGDLGEAVRRYGEGLKIAQQLVASDAANSEWQRDLSVSHEKLGDIAEAQGDLGEAARRYGESLKIRRQLAASDAKNSEWQRDLSVSYNKQGNVAEAQGDLGEAARRYGEGLKIRRQLAATDTANSEWQRDLWVSHWKLADLAEQQNTLDEALAHWKAALAVLVGIEQKGWHLSPADREVLALLRQKVGGDQ